MVVSVHEIGHREHQQEGVGVTGPEQDSGVYSHFAVAWIDLTRRTDDRCGLPCGVDEPDLPRSGFGHCLQRVGQRVVPISIGEADAEGEDGGPLSESAPQSETWCQGFGQVPW